MNLNSLVALLDEAAPECAHTDLAVFDKAKRRSGHVSAIYFLMRDGQIVYIGQTINLRNRIAGHHVPTEEYDEVIYMPVQEERLNALEGQLIAAFNPPLNVNPAPGMGMSVAERMQAFRDRQRAAGMRQLPPVWLHPAESAALDTLTASGQTVRDAVGGAIVGEAKRKEK